MTLNECFKENGFYSGRMISDSKSRYRMQNPNSVCYFNANIITVKDGKVWWGDLDLTKDGEKLKKIADEAGVILYVLKELDGRFENEDESGVKLVDKAVWDTTQEIPFV